MSKQTKTVYQKGTQNSSSSTDTNYYPEGKWIGVGGMGGSGGESTDKCCSTEDLWCEKCGKEPSDEDIIKEENVYLLSPNREARVYQTQKMVKDFKDTDNENLWNGPKRGKNKKVYKNDNVCQNINGKDNNDKTDLPANTTSEQMDARNKFISIRNNRISLIQSEMNKNKLIDAYTILDGVRLTQGLGDTMLRELLIEAKSAIEKMIADFCFDDQYWRNKYKESKEEATSEDYKNYYDRWNTTP